MMLAGAHAASDNTQRAELGAGPHHARLPRLRSSPGDGERAVAPQPSPTTERYAVHGDSALPPL